MKTRQAFFDEFFSRLTDMGFTVKPLYENDIAAEVYAGPSLFCVITQDGDVIYEDYNADQARQLEQAAANTRTKLGFCTAEHFHMSKPAKTVNLSRGTFTKVFESVGAVMLCRYSELFGYEFTTCIKAPDSHNKRMYYRELLFVDHMKAHASFLERSGFPFLQELPVLNIAERELVLECCTRRVMLDNDLDSSTESRINTVIQKMESILPDKTELSPGQFFLDERM